MVFTKAEYNFDEIIDRKNTNSIKFDETKQLVPLAPDDTIPMWVADMDFACPHGILTAMKEWIDRVRLFGYSAVLDGEFYDTVVKWCMRRYGVTIRREEIAYSSGVVTAMVCTLKLVTKPGDGVIIMTPSYHPFDDSAKKCGCVPIYSELAICDGRYEIDWDDLERKAARPDVKLLFLCNPHNPTGRVWTEAEVKRIGEICFNNGVFVFSDEIHCDLLRTGVAFTPIGKLFPDEKRIITAFAPSKTFNMAGLGFSVVIIRDEELAKKWQKTDCGMPNPVSIAAAKAAWSDCDDWLEALKRYLDDNFVLIKERLKNELGIDYAIPDGTYFLWLDLKKYGGIHLLKDRIARRGLFIEYGDEFVSNGGDYVRINIACPRKTLSAAMDRLISVLKY